MTEMFFGGTNFAAAAIAPSLVSRLLEGLLLTHSDEIDISTNSTLSCESSTSASLRILSESGMFSVGTRAGSIS